MKYISLGIFIFFTINCQAEVLAVNNAKVTRLYVQSLNGPLKSGGHAIAVDKTIDSSCGYRLYLDPLDKELFSTLLAYKISGTPFNFMYSKGESGKRIEGHTVTTCKVFTVY